MNVYYLSLLADTPCNSYWDYGYINDLLSQFSCSEVREIPHDDFGIVVIPSRSHYQIVDKINHELGKLQSVILFLMGDEQSVFPVEKIKHENIRIWVQNPKPGRHDSYTRIGCGYPQKIKDCTELPNKKLDWFFSGQVTHERRRLCVNVLPLAPGRGRIIPSGGFAQGLDQKKYYENMANSKIIPCPSGLHTPDTFRLFESLELGCIPIADNETPLEDWTGFWNWLFDEDVPFTKINRYSDLPGYIEDLLPNYPKLNNKIQAWWFRYKTKLQKTLYSQIEGLSGVNPGKSKVSVVIPVSPIPSHPDIGVLEETIASIRYHLPNSEIIITFDGIREEHKHLEASYNEHIRRVLWQSRFWSDITPYIFDEHKHQVGMMRSVIDTITTPLLLYVEQDTPLVTDELIDWQLLENTILSGQSNLIRLHHEGVIPDAHKHLMLGEVENNLLKTVQWSQRPHLASKAFYRRVLSEQFSDKAKCFIEDLLHGRVMDSYNQDGINGWQQWRIHIYHPQTGNIKRSYHADGRAGAEKYDTDQIW